MKKSYSKVCPIETTACQFSLSSKGLSWIFKRFTREFIPSWYPSRKPILHINVEYVVDSGLPHTINRLKPNQYAFTLFDLTYITIPLCFYSLDPMTNASVVDLLATQDRSLMSSLRRGPSWVRVMAISLIVFPKTSHSSSRKRNKLHFAISLVNLDVLHHVSVIVIVQLLILWS